MKSVLAVSILVICLLSACSVWQDAASPTPSPTEISADDITSFSFSNSSLGYSTHYSVNLEKLTAHIEGSNFYGVEINTDVQWSQEKWDSFIADILGCGVQNWNGDYDRHCTDGDSWSVTIKGGFGTIAVRGNSLYPDTYDDLRLVLDRYFRFEPPPGAPAAELITEAALPAPEEGDWYEWDKAGNYPGNSSYQCGSLFYIEGTDTIVRISNDRTASNLISSRLDGSNVIVLDNDVYGFINYYDGFIYYEKEDGIYKTKPDGSGKQQVKEEWVIQFIYDGRIYTDFNQSYSLEGEDIQTVILHGSLAAGFFFISGDLYYLTEFESDEGSNRIYRCDLKTGDNEELARGTSPFFIRNGMLYYMGNNLSRVYRTDGNTTESLNFFSNNYNMYRNYIIWIDETDYMLCALNADTNEVYRLFEVPFSITPIVMENSVFLYSGYASDPVYRITFENDTAKLWRLNGLSGSV